MASGALSLPTNTDADVYDALNEDLLGEEINLKILCSWRDNEVVYLESRMGHDVTRVKAELLKALKGGAENGQTVSYDRLSLWVDKEGDGEGTFGKMLMDPLSLCDIAELTPGDMIELKAVVKDS